MSRLFDAYRAFHEQGFVPIFVDSGLDSKMLVEACVNAGMKGIEYTLRRPDAHEMIPWIRHNCPELFLLAGSTLDDDRILAQRKKLHPQLLSVAELDAIGVDGFVSMIGWSMASIRKYSPTRIIAPTAMTVTEAFQQTAAGAQLIKMMGDIALIKRCRGDAAFGYCPILVTGGQTPDKIPETIAAGAVMIASGFDLILKGMPADVTCTQVTDALRIYMDTTREARAACWPKMSAAIGGAQQEWLNALPHYHPF